MTYENECILRMNVTEFKAFKRAVAVMCRLGLSYSKAVDILLQARIDCAIQRNESLYK